MTLGVGLTVLVLFLTLAQLTVSLTAGPMREILREGLVITGWVAMEPTRLTLSGIRARRRQILGVHKTRDRRSVRRLWVRKSRAVSCGGAVYVTAASLRVSRAPL